MKKVLVLTINNVVVEVAALVAIIAGKITGINTVAAWVELSTNPIVAELPDAANILVTKGGKPYNSMTGQAVKQGCEYATELKLAAEKAAAIKESARLEYEKVLAGVKAKLESLRFSYAPDTTADYSQTSNELSAALALACPAKK